MYFGLENVQLESGVKKVTVIFSFIVKASLQITAKLSVKVKFNGSNKESIESLPLVSQCEIL